MEARREAEFKFIRGETGGFMLEGCLGEVYCRQKVRPVVLIVIDEGP